MDNDKIVTEPTQTTPDLDVIMKEGLKQFDIPPEESKPTVEPISEAGTGPAAAVTKEKEDAAPAPATTAAAETARFKSHDEAEKGYKNLQSELTRVNQQNKELTGKLTAKEQSDQQKLDIETATQEFETFATDLRTKLLNEIDALDPDDKDYRTKVAAAQARADRILATAGQKLTAAAKTPTTPAPAAPAPNAEKQTDNAKPTAEQITAYVREKIVTPENGLDKDDVLFWTYAAQAPVKNEAGKDMTLDEQIQWSVEQTKQYHSAITPPIDKSKIIADAAKIAAANQKREMPLGGGGNAAPARTEGDDNIQVSLSDAVDAANNLRRL